MFNKHKLNQLILIKIKNNVVCLHFFLMERILLIKPILNKYIMQTCFNVRKHLGFFMISFTIKILHLLILSVTSVKNTFSQRSPANITYCI